MENEATDSLVSRLKARLGANRATGAGELQAAKQAPWPAGTAACDICRRTILTGEQVSRFRRDDRVFSVCPLCEGKMLAQGLVRAA